MKTLYLLFAAAFLAFQIHAQPALKSALYQADGKLDSFVLHGAFSQCEGGLAGLQHCSSANVGMLISAPVSVLKPSHQCYDIALMRWAMLDGAAPYMGASLIEFLRRHA